MNIQFHASRPVFPGRPSPTNRLVGALTCSDSDMSVHGRYAEESQGLSTTPSSPKGDTTMGLIGLIISWIIIGGIIGLIARALMPGKQAMGLGLTIVLGVIGAVVGGFIGGLFGGDGVSGIMNNPWRSEERRVGKESK